MTNKYKKRKHKIVLASGVFDLLHLGHVKFLEEAKKAGGKGAELIVIVARDATVKKIKGKKPVIPENQRRALIESLKVVDKAVLGYEELNIEKIIEKIKPDIIVTGYDQKEIERAVRHYVEKKHLPIKIVKIRKFGRNQLESSSKIMQKILDHY